MGALKDVLRTEGFFEWDVIVEEDKNERVATILGMLERAKIRMATLSQRRPFGKIIMKKRESAQFMDN
jgi:chromatin segregation and condensation protein Rec8/ScpA/Scc1 (kleisin family)